MHHDPGIDQRGQHVRRHLLVVEGHDVALLREREDRLEVGVRAHRGRGDDQGRARVGRLGEHAQREPELGGRAGAHPGELPSPDDADDGESSGCTHGEVTRGGYRAGV